MAARASVCCLQSCSSTFASSSRRPFSTAPYPTNSFLRPAVKPVTTKTVPPSSTSSPPLIIHPGVAPVPKVVFDQPGNVTYPQNQVKSTRMSHAGNQGTELRRTSLKGAFSNARFRVSVARKEFLPAKTSLQEIIFAGRSNVGKSSLINALLCSDSLVKTSSRAGHTTMLNFFDVPNQMVIVDAPGYGDKGRPEWGELFSYYVTQHPPSPPSILLVLYPLNHKLLPSDQIFLASLPAHLNVLPVFTKSDEVEPRLITLKRAALERAIQAARESAWTEEDAVGAKGKLLDSVCVSTQRRFPLRDETLELLRKTILDQLEATAMAHKDTQQAYSERLKSEGRERHMANIGKGSAQRLAEEDENKGARGEARTPIKKRPSAAPVRSSRRGSGARR